jgi:hypothetical protein
LRFPPLIDKAGSEPGWAMAIGISAGWMTPERGFDGADPSWRALRKLIVTESDGALAGSAYWSR